MTLRTGGAAPVAGTTTLDQRVNVALRLFFSSPAGARVASRMRDRPPAAASGAHTPALASRLRARAERHGPGPTGDPAAPPRAGAPPIAAALPLANAPGAGPRDPARAAVATRTTELTTRRLVEQRRRVEQLARRSTASLPSVSGVDPETGWPLPVGQTPVAPRVRTRSRGGMELAPTPAAARAAVQQTGADAPASAALDIGRLADQVVEQIDRRIVAHRERMGRI